MSEPIIRLIFLLQLTSTLFMFGLIWFVQVVHYPLFGNVGIDEFREYEHAHTRLTQRVVSGPMLVELATAILLVWFRPPGVSLLLCVLGLILLGVIWGSTMFVQIPCHEALTSGFDAKIHRRLVTSNWVRTVAWSMRAGMVLGMSWMMMQ